MLFTRLPFYPAGKLPFLFPAHVLKLGTNYQLKEQVIVSYEDNTYGYHSYLNP